MFKASRSDKTITSYRANVLAASQSGLALGSEMLPTSHAITPHLSRQLHDRSKYQTWTWRSTQRSRRRWGLAPSVARQKSGNSEPTTRSPAHRRNPSKSPPKRMPFLWQRPGARDVLSNLAKLVSVYDAFQRPFQRVANRVSSAAASAPAPAHDNITLADGSVMSLQALRRGIRNERGDMAYFLPSFLEDPWEELGAEQA